MEEKFILRKWGFREKNGILWIERWRKQDFIEKMWKWDFVEKMKFYEEKIKGMGFYGFKNWEITLLSLENWREWDFMD